MSSTGSSVYGTSRALFEEVRFEENMVTSVDWLTYPVLHIDSVPQSIEIHLIDRPEASPSGAAEMALGLVPAAIGNAVFDATGVRLRRVPSPRARETSAGDTHLITHVMVRLDRATQPARVGTPKNIRTT
jgi:CO/xanthine dehydrogenase Mo-binding subunit